MLDSEKAKYRYLMEYLKKLDPTKSDDELYEGARRLCDFVESATKIHAYVEKAKKDGTYVKPKKIDCKYTPYRIPDPK
jgi:hypothetical protein